MLSEIRQKFPLGSRVVSSYKFRSSFPRKASPVCFGTVVGYPISFAGIRVQRDDIQTVESYHPEFWDLWRVND
jgi:hypothetical protein